MYADPKHIKKNAYKVSLNDVDQTLLEAAARAVGQQPSAYIRELAMEKLRESMEIRKAPYDGEINRRASQ